MPDEPEYELVMPFVVCASEGGPYDDLSFCAGYDAARIAAKLEQRPAMHGAVVRTPLIPQLDLIAMKAGFSVHLHDTDDDEWTYVIFARENETADA